MKISMVRDTLVARPKGEVVDLQHRWVGVYFSIPSRQKKVLPGSRSYFSKTLGKISGYFASLRGIQNIVAGFFGLPPTPTTTNTGIRFDRE